VHKVKHLKVTGQSPVYGDPLQVQEHIIYKDLDAVSKRSPQFLPIGRVYVISWSKPFSIHPLDQVEHDASVSLAEFFLKLHKMFEAPGSDSVREIASTILHQSAIFYLYKTSLFSALEKEVDSRVLTVTHFSPDRFIASKGPDLFADD